MNDMLTGRVFEVGSGPTAAALRTNRIPGDANDDGAVNPVDVVFMVNRVYLGNNMLPRSNAGDVNHDCAINPVDVVLLVAKVYLGSGMMLLWGCVP